jgi:predicted transglutaminase-like cysteine proteinase
MTPKHLWKALAFAAFSLLHFATAQAAPANMITRGATNPPIGHYQFCKAHKDQCGYLGPDKGPMALTEDRWKAILRVNTSVNNAIQPLSDAEVYGVEERWTYPTDVGDCEDYVLLKRKMLIDSGLSPSDLLITVALQPNGDGHAVLTVRTDRGDFVLDNMRNKVLLWSETEYSYLKRQSSTDASRWVKIEAGEASAVSSVE